MLGCKGMIQGVWGIVVNLGRVREGVLGCKGVIQGVWGTG